MRWPLLIAFASLSACAGELENPERFEGTFADAMAACDVEGTLFPDTCGLSACHDAVEPGGGLDLVTDGVAGRVVGVAATCAGTSALLVDPADVDASFLLEKIGGAPSCGDPMPLSGEPLPAAQVACVRTWIEEQL